MDNTIIGIDVSKAKLDIFILATGQYLTITNDKQGYKKLLKEIKDKYTVERAIIEHTGNYQKGVVTFLQEHDYSVSVVNPSRVRSFARTTGVLAKTDKLDAVVLAKYGEKYIDEIPITDVSDDILTQLREMVSFRRQIVDTITEYKNRLEKSPLSYIKKEIKKTISTLEKQKTDIQKKLREYIKEHQTFANKKKILEQVQGIGEQTSLILLAELPELGLAKKSQLSALCGLAPINCDSGKKRGQRHIKGGRKVVRNALYMAAVSASRHNKVISEYYQHLLQRGKLKKVALVACARKLLIYTNSLLHNI